jgi:hypothetical protein
MDLDIEVTKLAQVGPVTKIPRGPIYLVKDHTDRCALSQAPNHVVEHRPSGLGGGLSFLKPLGNHDLLALGVSLDGISLLLQLYTILTLLGGRHPCVGKIFIHKQLLIISQHRIGSAKSRILLAFDNALCSCVVET